ncbi:hypothetical protein Tco_0416002 [Tanacetum coccineum]
MTIITTMMLVLRGRVVRRGRKYLSIVYEFDAWMEDVGTYDVKVHVEEASQELLEEMSKEIDEAKLQNAVDEMLRQRYNSGEEHQYHVD